MIEFKKTNSNEPESIEIMTICACKSFRCYCSDDMGSVTTNIHYDNYQTQYGMQRGNEPW